MARTIAEEIAELIVRRIETEPEDVRLHILAAVYDRLGGQLAQNSSGGFPPLKTDRRRLLSSPSSGTAENDDDGEVLESESG